MNEGNAMEIAVAALVWLTEDEGRIGAFLAATGADPSALRASAEDPAFMGSVLDHVMTDDALVIGAAGFAHRPPEDIAAARAALPGGDLPHWT